MNMCVRGCWSVCVSDDENWRWKTERIHFVFGEMLLHCLLNWERLNKYTQAKLFKICLKYGTKLQQRRKVIDYYCTTKCILLNTIAFGRWMCGAGDRLYVYVHAIASGFMLYIRLCLHSIAEWGQLWIEYLFIRKFQSVSMLFVLSGHSINQMHIRTLKFRIHFMAMENVDTSMSIDAVLANMLLFLQQLKISNVYQRQRKSLSLQSPRLSLSLFFSITKPSVCVPNILLLNPLHSIDLALSYSIEYIFERANSNIKCSCWIMIT